MYIINDEQARQVGNLNHVAVLQRMALYEKFADEYTGTFPEISEALGFGTLWTVTNAVQALATKGLVEFTGKSSVRLTDSGWAMVEKVGRKQTQEFLATAYQREDVQAGE